MSSVEDVKKNLAKKAEVFQRVFTSLDGMEALRILTEEFDALNIYTQGDPHGTSYKLGSRDVVIYIKQLIKHKGE